VVDVRAATAEELAHGHIHGGVGCGHHEEGGCGGGSCGNEGGCH